MIQLTYSDYIPLIKAIAKSSSFEELKSTLVKLLLTELEEHHLFLCTRRDSPIPKEEDLDARIQHLEDTILEVRELVKPEGGN